jgi:hypothetical protein
MAHLVYHDVLEPYTYPVPHQITKYNRMMVINRDLYDDMAYDPAKLQIMQGPLLLSPIEAFSYADDIASVQWYPAGEGAETQDVCAVMMYAEELDKVYITISRREVMQVDTTMPEGLTPDKIHCYLVFARPPAAPGDTGEVSNTSYAVAAAGRKADAAKK